MEAEKQQKYEKFGGRLKELREAAGLSQKELAARSNVSQTMISKSERGETRLSGTPLLLAAAVLGTEPEEIGEPTEGIKPPPDFGRKRTAEEKLLIRDYGARIRRRRRELGLTIAELAELLGVGDTALGEWERGLSMPAGENRDMLEQAIGVRFETRETGPAAADVLDYIRRREEEKAKETARKRDTMAAARAAQIRRQTEALIGTAAAARAADEEEQEKFGAALTAAREKDAQEEDAAARAERAISARQANMARARAGQRAAMLKRYGRLEPRQMTEEERNAFNGYGAKLKELREAAGLTVTQAAGLLGMDSGGWSSWEVKGTIPSAKARQKLEALLGIQEPELPQQPAAAEDKSGDCRITVLPPPMQNAHRPGRKPEDASTLLDYTCILAREAGMHYGDYVAMTGSEAIRKGWESVLAARAGRKKKRKETA